jgi:hypothetical protein
MCSSMSEGGHLILLLNELIDYIDVIPDLINDSMPCYTIPVAQNQAAVAWRSLHSNLTCRYPLQPPHLSTQNSSFLALPMIEPNVEPTRNRKLAG